MVRTAMPGAVLLLLVSGAGFAQTKTQSPRFAKLLSEYSAALEDLAQSASPSVVQIVVKTLTTAGKGESQRNGFVSEQEATGSGVIVAADGYIVTNSHVVQNARSIDVRIFRSEERGQDPHLHLMPARLIGLDRLADIAVVKIEANDLPALSFVNSDNLKPGQLVLAVGSPLGLQNSVTNGVVSAVARQLNPEIPMVFIQTDAPINPGNSGGPLLDSEGRIAGINTMIYSQSGGNEGIGFAIPSSLVKDLYEKIRKDGRIRRGAIGVIPETITPALGAALGLNKDSGVILSDVTPRSAAEVAGLQPGDVVLSVDGKPMREERDLALAVFGRSSGDVLSMEIQRGQQRMKKNVAVLDQTTEPGKLEDLANYDASLVRELGILAVTLDAKVTPILPNLRRLSGVVVAAVPTEYAGLNPGLVAGDVIYSLNNHQILSLEELRNALKASKSGDPIALQVERFGQLIYVTAVPE